MKRIAAVAGVLFVAVMGSLPAAATIAAPETASSLGMPTGAVPFEDPFYVSDRVEDPAGVLSDADERAVRDASLELSDETSVDLFTVYIDSFDGQSAGTWADTAAITSGMGSNDVLLVIAVQDRAWAISVGADGDLEYQVAESLFIDNSQAELSRDNWAQGSIAFAEAIQSELSRSGGIGAGTVAAIAGIAVIGGAGVYWWSRSRKRTATATRTSNEQASLAELEQRAGVALVQVDNVLRASEQELGFAQAQFGVKATEQYTAAVAEARTQVTSAFEIQKALQDSVPETDDPRRQGFLQILSLTKNTLDSLRAQKASFDELRSLERQAEDVLAKAETEANEVRARIDGARSIVATLATRYAESTLTSVSSNPDQAEKLLDSAKVAIDAGRQQVAQNDRSAAVVNARIAEQAIDQASTLLDEVGSAHEMLADAKSRLSQAIASISADIADADRLAPSDSQVMTARAAAQSAIEAGNAALAGGDPLAAIQNLTQSEAKLDNLLASYREAYEVTTRAQTAFDRRLPTVQSLVARADALIRDNRGAMDTRPRALLTQATTFLQQAEGLRETDPAQGIQLLDQASVLANEAITVGQAQRDSFPWQTETRYRNNQDVGSLIVGGILDALFDDDRRYRPNPWDFSNDRGWSSSNSRSGSWGGSWGRSSASSSRGSSPRSSGGGRPRGSSGGLSRGGGSRRSGGGRY